MMGSSMCFVVFPTPMIFVLIDPKPILQETRIRVKKMSSGRIIGLRLIGYL